MSGKNKIFISAIGLAAVIVPAILLIFLSSKVPAEPAQSNDSRTIDTVNIDSAVKPPPQRQIVVPSPFAASGSAPVDLSSDSPSQQATQSGSQ